MVLAEGQFPGGGQRHPVLVDLSGAGGGQFAVGSEAQPEAADSLRRRHLAQRDWLGLQDARHVHGDLCAVVALVERFGQRLAHNMEVALVPPTAGGWMVIGVTVVSIMGSAVLVARNPTGFAWNRFSFFRETAVRIALMVLLAAVSVTAINEHLGTVECSQARYAALNQIDSARLERGYYENLMAVDRFNGELWRLYMKRPPDWADSIIERGLAVATHDFRIHKLKPSVEDFLNGVTFRTNRWGIHDKEYEKQAPAGCFRIAMLGDSYVMAHMVEHEKDFESKLEDRLNGESTGQYTSWTRF